MKKTALLLTSAALLLMAAGCGYRLAQTRAEPGAGDSPAVVEFRDMSREPLFGPLFIRELERKFVERTAPGTGGRAPEIKTTLGALTETPRALNTGGHPAEYLLQASADAIVTLPGGETLKTAVSATREFASGKGLEEIRAARGRAIEQLARDLADRLAARLTDLMRAKPASGEK